MRQHRCAIFGLFLAGLLAAALPVKAETRSSSEKPSDTWLETKLDTTILLNRHLSLYDIDTSVQNRTVYLKGTVDTVAEKELAEEIAKSIEGVAAVRNDIVVDRTAAAALQANRPKERSFGQIIDDLTTTAAIKSKIVTSNAVSVLDVGVSTENGTVTLTGTVKSDTEKELAGKMAENVSGVRAVNNRIKITS